MSRESRMMFIYSTLSTFTPHLLDKALDAGRAGLNPKRLVHAPLPALAFVFPIKPSSISSISQRCNCCYSGQLFTSTKAVDFSDVSPARVLFHTFDQYEE